jgi:hypothetical protein
MTLLLLSALIMGGLGSLHCIGMCGPIALALPVVTDTAAGKFLYSLLYNSGRVVTYIVIGSIAGLLGSGFALAGLQQWLSVLLGVFIISYLLWPKQAGWLQANNTIQGVFKIVRNRLSYLFHQKNYRSVFFIGILNGLLPCGLVYMALAAAIATGSVWQSGLFMAFFGLGTLPLMWSLAFFGNFITVKSRIYIRKAYPYMMFATACLLIVRGMGLGIPYLSPIVDMEHSAKSAIECHIVER